MVGNHINSGLEESQEGERETNRIIQSPWEDYIRMLLLRVNIVVVALDIYRYIYMHRGQRDGEIPALQTFDIAPTLRLDLSRARKCRVLFYTRAFRASYGKAEQLPSREPDIRVCIHKDFQIHHIPDSLVVKGE